MTLLNHDEFSNLNNNSSITPSILVLRIGCSALVELDWLHTLCCIWRCGSLHQLWRSTCLILHTFYCLWRCGSLHQLCRSTCLIHLVIIFKIVIGTDSMKIITSCRLSTTRYRHFFLTVQCTMYFNLLQALCDIYPMRRCQKGWQLNDYDWNNTIELCQTYLSWWFSNLKSSFYHRMTYRHLSNYRDVNTPNFVLII